MKNIDSIFKFFLSLTICINLSSCAADGTCTESCYTIKGVLRDQINDNPAKRNDVLLKAIFWTGAFGFTTTKVAVRTDENVFLQWLFQPVLFKIILA